MLQALFVALIVGFAVQAMGSKGEPVLNFVTVLQRLVFKILGGIMWLAPIGAFGAIAGVVGNAGWSAIGRCSACWSASSTPPVPCSWSSSSARC